MLRRDFLALAASVSVATPAKRVVVAAHPWVFAATQPQHDITPILDSIFADLKYAGIEAIELMHTALRPADSVERIGELSVKHKLPVIGSSYDAKMWDREQHNAILDDAHVVLERLGKLGGRTLGTSVGYKKDRKTPEELDAQAELLRKIMALCAKNKVVLNLHNHVYEVRDDEYDLSNTLRRIPDAKLGPDIGWLVRAKVDPVDFIRRRGSQMVYAHLRDEKADGKWPEAMGEGVIDYAAVGRALRAAGFAGDLAIELAHEKGFQLTRPLRESLKISREYVRRVMGY
jgi:sugar phosphate isomerase/epimerase